MCVLGGDECPGRCDVMGYEIPVWCAIAISQFSSELGWVMRGLLRSLPLVRAVQKHHSPLPKSGCGYRHSYWVIAANLRTLPRNFLSRPSTGVPNPQNRGSVTTTTCVVGKKGSPCGRWVSLYLPYPQPYSLFLTA